MAQADSPADALRSALERTAAAKTAHVKLTQTVGVGTRRSSSVSQGTLAHGDVDIVGTGEGGEARRVAVGTKTYERRPNTPDAPWKQGSRPSPGADAAFGTLRLADGRRVSDPTLYRSITDAGTQTLPQGQARTLVGEVDLGALGSAMRMSSADRARLAAMTATLTVWVGVADGAVWRHRIALTIPGASGPTQIETTLDLADLDAPLVVSAP